MTFEEVQQYLKDNANSQEVQELLKPTAETVNNFLDTDQGAKLLQPRLDGHFTKGLQTWKDNHLSKIVEEEIAKVTQESPETKRIRELEQKVAKAEQERTQERLKNVAAAQLSERKLPIELVDLVTSSDEETTTNIIDKVASIFDNAIKTSVEQRFKTNGREVANPTQTTKTISKEQFNAMSYEQKVDLYKNQPEVYQELTKE